MSKTQYLELKGIIEWAKVFKENRDMVGYRNAFVPYDGACTVDIFLDKDNLKILKDSGSSMELDKKDRKSDKGYKVKFNRRFLDEANPRNGGAPSVVKFDGSPWSLDEDGLIGNGSLGIVYISMFESKDGSNIIHRLDGLQILEHVEYDGEFSSGPQFKDYSDTYGMSKETLENEIPF